MGNSADRHAGTDEGAFAKAAREEDIDQLVKKFRRQDRTTTRVLVSFFIALFAVLAAWTWHHIP